MIPESYLYSLISLQPRLKRFPLKQFGKKKKDSWSFNSKWFDNEKWSAWLHWDSETETAYCLHVCVEMSTC